MSKVINEYGRVFDYSVAESYMNRDLTEELHFELAPCSKQEFFDAYCKAHEQRFGEEWELAKPNPVW